MPIQIAPCRKITGSIQLPGDKSISHRLAMLGAIADGKTVIDNFATSADCHSTLSCLRLLGVGIESTENQRIIIHGQGLRGLQSSQAVLDAGNSGSTIRMLSGILAGQNFTTQISGDSSLCQRPMKRVIIPLMQMGAHIEARDGNYPPMHIHGGKLAAIEYHLPVASAQVKSAVLLAGLYAGGRTAVVEPTPTRNHTELALMSFGANIQVEGLKVSVLGGQPLQAVSAKVPGDISSAAFFAAAASLLPGSDVILENVGLNPGRRGIVDILRQMGASIEMLGELPKQGEPVADLRVQSASLRGGKIAGAQIPGVIDEIPILAVLATQTEEGIEIRDAGELRVKESDRIKSIVENLRAMGATVEEFEDGFTVPGRQRLHGSRIKTYGDHRIAMAFAIAGLMAQGVTTIDEAECAAVSFPAFYETLARVASQ